MEQVLEGDGEPWERPHLLYIATHTCSSRIPSTMHGTVVSLLHLLWSMPVSVFPCFS